MITTRRIVAPGELALVDDLYREVFGIGPEDTGLNVRLLVALATNSGHVIGAFDGSRLVGFGASFLAREAASGRLYQYSQTVAIAATMQGRGIGRALKNAQREATLADGVHVMRWVFDPVHARNGHFNLDVLGGRIRSVHPDLYGAAAHRPDLGERTDRCLVEWDLTGTAGPSAHLPPTEALTALELTPGEAADLGEVSIVAVPVRWREFRAEVAPHAAAEVRAGVVKAIDAALARGLIGVSCRQVDEGTAAYVFAPEGQG